MSGFLNRVTIIGNLGRDPEIKTMQSGDKVANLTVATSEFWKDKASGERRERTQWHYVVVFNSGLIKLCEDYLRKGSKVYIEGQLETRKWEKDGENRYATEIVLRPYRGEITMLDSKPAKSEGQAPSYDQAPIPEMPEDDLPF